MSTVKYITMCWLNAYRKKIYSLAWNKTTKTAYLSRRIEDYHSKTHSKGIVLHEIRLTWNHCYMQCWFYFWIVCPWLTKFVHFLYLTGHSLLKNQIWYKRFSRYPFIFHLHLLNHFIFFSTFCLDHDFNMNVW